jgi:hypothetical protein
MTMSVHVTSAAVSDALVHDAQVLRSVLGKLRSAEGRSVVEELISGMLADGVVLARVDDVVTPGRKASCWASHFSSWTS